MKAKKHQEKRFSELNDLLGRRTRLTAEEYLDLLHEIRCNYTIALAMRSSIGNLKDTGALINILDKTHWLIDSAENKVKPTKADATIEVRFKDFTGAPPPDDVEA